MLEPAYLEISLHKFSFPLHSGDLKKICEDSGAELGCFGNSSKILEGAKAEIPQKSKGWQKLQSALAVKKILRTGLDIPQKS